MSIPLEMAKWHPIGLPASARTRALRFQAEDLEIETNCLRADVAFTMPIA